MKKTPTSSARLAQTRRSVERHRQLNDRLELFLPLGWRQRLKDSISGDSDHASMAAWFRATVAERIGEEVD